MRARLGDDPDQQRQPEHDQQVVADPVLQVKIDQPDVDDQESQQCPEEYLGEMLFDGMFPEVFREKMVRHGGHDEQPDQGYDNIGRLFPSAGIVIFGRGKKMQQEKQSAGHQQRPGECDFQELGDDLPWDKAGAGHIFLVDRETFFGMLQGAFILEEEIIDIACQQGGQKYGQVDLQGLSREHGEHDERFVARGGDHGG